MRLICIYLFLYFEFTRKTFFKFGITDTVDTLTQCHNIRSEKVLKWEKELVISFNSSKYKHNIATDLITIIVENMRYFIY